MRHFGGGAGLVEREMGGRGGRARKGGGKGGDGGDEDEGEGRPTIALKMDFGG